MKNIKKDYFYEAADQLNISVEEYLGEGLDDNFVILDNGEPLVWESNNAPVIYGDKDEALNEISEWGKYAKVANVSIITEREFLGRFCLEEYTKAIKEIAEKNAKGNEQLKRCHTIYVENNGYATWDEFKEAVEFGKINLFDYDYRNADELVRVIGSTIADMFICKDKDFKKWYDGLDEDTKVQVYGEVLGRSELQALIGLRLDLEYKNKTDKIRSKYEKKNGIMDTLNGHNDALVLKINDAWNKGRSNFKLILCALYERDIEEITDSDAFRIPTWIESEEHTCGVEKGDWKPYMAMALKDMKERWEAYADNYLMHIADDADLESILAFLHYPNLPIWR